MLKCVVFPVTVFGYEVISSSNKQTEKTLNEKNVDFYIFRIEDENGLTDFFREKEYQKSEMLFVTDCLDMLQQLLKNGYYAIAFYHEKNRKVFFQGALYAVEDVTQLTFRSYDEAYRRLAGLPWDILETEHLKVRESTVADVEDFYRMYAEPSVTYYMEDLFQDPDEERVYMENYIKQFYGFYGFGMWTVLLKETGQVIGRAGFSIREGYDLPELGFMLDVPFQKKGLAFEVCRAILNYGKEELYFKEVQALVETENEASLRLLGRLGFTFERKVTESGRQYQLLVKGETDGI